MASSTVSAYAKQNYTPNKTCTVIGGHAGQSYLKRWTNTTPAIPGVTPGNDGNNADLVFGLRDQYGIPIVNSTAAPDFSGYISGIQVPDTSGYQVATADAWLIVPAGINSVSFWFRGYGNTSAGLYAGHAPRYAKRVFWNNVLVLPGGTLDLTIYPVLCGCKIIFVRTYTCNGYFRGGHWLTWNIGAGLVDVPTTATFGDQPSQSMYPS